MYYLVAFISGLIFSIGLGVSSMTQPQKVIGFLDIFGNWDLSLAFVMLGAILVHSLFYILSKKRTSPVLDHTFQIPSRKDLPPRLFLGSSIFGVGWGIAGYCPGPALVSLFSGQLNSFIFVSFMLLGMIFYKLTKHLHKE